MTAKSASRSFLPLLIIFILTSLLFLFSRSLFEKWNIDTDVLMGGNLVLFIATAFSYYLYMRSIRTKNAYAIVRMIYGGVLSKLLVCLVAVFIYISVAGKDLNKEAIFGCMFLYVVYSVVEITTLMKLSKQKRNA